MTFSQEDCKKWLPYIQAIAMGKKLKVWNGCLEAPREGVEYTSDPRYIYTDDQGQEIYKARIDDFDIISELPIIRGNRTIVDPLLFYTIMDEEDSC